jgi:hypothetical protein
MSRVASAADMKRGPRGHSLFERPREGSALRRVYDMFIPPLTIVRTHKIAAEYGGKSRSAFRAVRQLIDFYGLDLRLRRHGEWWLVGEYVGSEYRDYFAEQARREGILPPHRSPSRPSEPERQIA